MFRIPIVDGLLQRKAHFKSNAKGGDVFISGALVLITRFSLNLESLSQEGMHSPFSRKSHLRYLLMYLC